MDFFDFFRNNVKLLLFNVQPLWMFSHPDWTGTFLETNHKLLSVLCRLLVMERRIENKKQTSFQVSGENATLDLKGNILTASY